MRSLAWGIATPISVLASIGIGGAVQAQISPNWIQRYDNRGEGYAWAASMALAPDGIVVIGAVSSGGTYTGVVKYDFDGNFLWDARIDVPNASPYAVACDGEGGVYVIGSTYRASNWDYFVARMSPSGQQLWAVVYGTDQYDYGRSIAIDPTGNIYACGESGSDGVVAKLSGDGTILWEHSGTGTADSLALTDEGVAVTGAKVVAGRGRDVSTRLLASDSTLLWHDLQDGSLSDNDYGVAVVFDAAGRILVGANMNGNRPARDVGAFSYSRHGHLVWRRVLDGGGNVADTVANGCVDRFGNLTLVGSTSDGGTFSNILTINLSRRGDVRYVQSYNGPANDIDYGLDVVADANGNSFVAGASSRDQTHGAFDYLVIKYDSAGNFHWELRQRGTAGGEDKAVAIVASEDGSVYVTGQALYRFPGGRDFLTVCIRPTDFVAPLTFAVTRGQYLSGGLLDLYYNDTFGVRVQALRPTSLNIPSVEIEVEGRSPTTSPTELYFVAETSPTVNGPIQRILAFNFRTGMWDVVDSRPVYVGRNTVAVRITESAPDYVRGDGLLRLRVGLVDYGVTFPAWGFMVDQFVWFVQQ
ncbi:MAG: SBBP repeat-containing protein [Armatimonadota bacterium]